MAKEFLDAVAQRRTFYSISKEAVISDDKIKEIIEHAVKHSPSAFNSQSDRAVLLIGNHHDKLWDIAKDALRKVVPADQFSQTEERINSFKSGYGTVLFYEDSSVVESLQKEYPLYQENFPVWSQQSNGMLQYIIWTALVSEGFGVSLQHYSNLIQNDVMTEWNIPESWKLIGQMPFGKPTARPDEKEYQPLEERFKIFK